MEEIISYIAKNGGFATMKEMKEANIHTRDITNLVRKNMIEKIKPGLYRLADYNFFKDINLSLITVCRAEPYAVICLLSALDYYELTDFNPSEIYYAIPHSKKSKSIITPPVKVFYFRERFYKPGIEVIKTKYGDIRIYNKEKTVCDMFRYRNKLGEELAMQALKNYLGQKKKSILTLIKFAEICQVKTVMIPIIKSLTV
ncbi:MAG: type IV toxin-antitoxin system AbiEi family antitoxin domain-containing protein [Ignavibacterium sp.]